MAHTDSLACIISRSSAMDIWLDFLVIYYFSGTDHLNHIGFFIRGAINVLCCLILGMMWREDWKNFSPKE